MAYSYTALRNRYGSLTNSTSSANLTLGDGLINDGIKKLLADRNDWPFLESSFTTTLVASQQFYDLPYDIDKLKAVTVNNGNVIYTPDEIISREEWDRLNTNTTVTSNIPEYYFIYAGRIGFWPTPSTASTTYSTGTIALTSGSATVTGSGTTFTSSMDGSYLRVPNGDIYLIDAFVSTTELTLNRVYDGATFTGGTYLISSILATITYKQIVKDLSVADYTTGTVAITNGSSVVTGSGTTFTTAMVGRYLKTTDGFWYKINSFTSTTVIGLDRAYGGTTITGASYTLGELSPLPDAYQDLPTYYAASQFWYVNDGVQRAREYERLFLEGKKALRTDWGNKTGNVIIGDDRAIINPNLTITIN